MKLFVMTTALLIAFACIPSLVEASLPQSTLDIPASNVGQIANQYCKCGPGCLLRCQAGINSCGDPNCPRLNDFKNVSNTTVTTTTTNQAPRGHWETVPGSCAAGACKMRWVPDAAGDATPPATQPAQQPTMHQSAPVRRGLFRGRIFGRRGGCASCG